MQRLYHLIQYVAPVVGLVGIGMIIIGVKGTPQNWALVQQSMPILILAFVFRPKPDHPMFKLMGMRGGLGTRKTGKPKDTPEAKEAKAFLAEFLEQNMAVLEHDPGELPHHKAPVKVIPQMPGAKDSGRSWIGGKPMLPEDMPWPEANGKPMLFLAQIALNELPNDIWGGLGPRDGWLAFFTPSKGRIDDDFLVFHLTGPVATRDWPEMPQSFYFGYGGDKAREALAEAGFHVPPHPPRFDVAILNDDGPDTSDGSEENQRFAIQKEHDPRQAIFRPFDTHSARGFVASLLSGQRQALQSLQRERDGLEVALQKSDDPQDRAKIQGYIANTDQERPSREAALAALQAVQTRLAAKPDAPLDPSEVNAQITELDAIEVQRFRKTKDGAKWSTHKVIDEFWAQSVSRDIFDMQVQEAMRHHPDRVPDATRARYETLWRYNQSHEYATMGGPVHTGFIYSRARNPVFLLELPSSSLVGWMFGDVSSLGVFIDSEDMKAGRWDKAWGDIRN